MTRYFCAALFLLFGSGIIFSQNTYDFLRLDISPRTAAIGGSFVAGTDDPNVMFYNPLCLFFELLSK
jgi:hypothetical protein